MIFAIGTGFAVLMCRIKHKLIWRKKNLVKIYWLMWLLGVLAVEILYFMGLFTPKVAILFGFISFGAIFLGIIGVLPISITHSPQKH